MPTIDQSAFAALILSRVDVRRLGYLFLIFFVLYAYEITNFNLSIDDEIVAYDASGVAFVDLGRWVFPLIRETLWPQLVTPLGPYLIFGLCAALGYLYLLRAFGIGRPGLFHYAAFGAFVLFPVWIAQLEFAPNIIPLAAAVLSASTAALLAARTMGRPLSGQAGAILAAAALVAVSAGAYQSAILIVPVILIGVIIHERLIQAPDSETGLLHLLPVPAGILLAGAALYFLIAKIVMSAYGIEPSDYGRRFVHTGLLLHHPGEALALLIKDVEGVFYTWWKPFGIMAHATVAALSAGAAICLYAVRDSWTRMAWTAAGLVLILTLPAAFSLLSGAQLPLRTLLAAPFALLVLLLLLHHSVESRAVRVIAMLATGVIGLEGLYIQSIYQARAAVVQRHDMLFASALSTDIRKTLDLSRDAPIRVDFDGLEKSVSVYPRLPTTTAGASFFEWDNGNPYRMIRYMNLIGFHAYVAIDDETRARIKPRYTSMPAWPARGSIAVQEGIVLVKLSD